MIITDNTYQKLEVKPMENDAVAICEAVRTSTIKAWKSKIILVNKREALGIFKAIQDIVLNVPSNEAK